MQKTKKTNNIKYKVQIGAYSKALPAYVERMYNKLSVLRKIDHYTDDNGIVVYTVGNVDNFDDAVQLQKQIRQEGIKDAFVVAYNNGKRITLSEAREIQKNE
jgi:cell division protein FtsN